MIVFPKTEFENFCCLEESKRPSLYVLLGEDDKGNPQAYIGESAEGGRRISEQKRIKLFWRECLVFVAKDNSINKADIEYLEGRAIDVANECARYLLTNSQSGKKSSLSKHQIDIIEEFFDDVMLLASFMGCAIFDKEESTGSSANKVFHVKRKGVLAKGIFNERDHTIRLLKGTCCLQETSKSYSGAAKRDALLSKIARKTNDGFWVLKQDYVVDSPSTAASYVTGSPRNGWTEWINDDGQTLNDIYRNEQSSTDIEE